MIDDELRTVVRYQTCLFTALTGVLVGRKLTSRTEITAALSVVESFETDETVAALIGLLRESLLDSDAAPSEGDDRPVLELISGGKK